MLFLGSSPERVDDLCFHIYGEFSPSPPSSSPTSPSPHLKSQSRGPNSRVEAKIPVLHLLLFLLLLHLSLKSQSRGPNSSPEPLLFILFMLQIRTASNILTSSIMNIMDWIMMMKLMKKLITVFKLSFFY